MAVKSYTFEPESIDALIRIRKNLYGDNLETAQQAKQIRRLLGRNFSFHADPGNDHKCFLATHLGKPVGHVVAFVNKQLKGPDGKPVGAIGFFECMDDYYVASDLLNAAIDWIKCENDLTRIWGPIQFDIWHGYRFKTRGFNVNSFTGEPTNKPYYPHFFEQYGFKPKWHWNSAWIAEPGAMESLIYHRAPKLSNVLGKILRFTTVSDQSDLRALYPVIMDSFQSLFGFTPLSFKEFARQGLAQCKDARLVTIVKNQNNRILAFAVAYPNVRTYSTNTQSSEEAVLFLIGTTSKWGIYNEMLAHWTVYHAVRQCFHAGYNSVVLAMMRKSAWLNAVKIKRLDDAISTYAFYELEI